ncbi:trehalose-phosphatase [Aquibium sp. LZ166]|uniref:Trehalose 6-phosphate phosphatase n=1 Tax=Aquibium pacificus TaxID=3153579 RepID=A0ABV3SFI0_9HYPH
MNETQEAADFASMSLDPARTAFFFDFDGTLAEIVDDPKAVTIGDDVRDALVAIRDAAGGALAVISGREIAAIDRFLAPLTLPVGGAHGSERRGVAGEVHRAAVDPRDLDRLAERVADFARGVPGTTVETKRTSVALHYRRNPSAERNCIAFAEELAGEYASASLLAGKMVLEFKFSARTKADVIGDFMAEEPFCGRRPVYFGDDVTDEDAFRVLPEWDGLAVKIGEGPSIARYRLADPAALHAWMKRLAKGESR